MDARKGAAALMATAAAAQASVPAPADVVTDPAVLRAPPEFPGMRPATRRALALLYEAAAKYWDRQGVARVGDPSQVYVADSLAADDGDPVGRGTGIPFGAAQNRIYLQRGYLRGELARARQEPLGGNRRLAIRRLYNLMLHEEGHVRGRPHEESGPMVPVMLLTSNMPRGWRPVTKEILGRDYRDRRFWRMTPEGDWVRRERPRRS